MGVTSRRCLFTVAAVLAVLGGLRAPARPAATKGGASALPVVLAGGDLPHPVTLAVDDVMNRLPGSDSLTPRATPPDTTATAPYRLSVGSDQYLYYPLPAATGVALCTTCAVTPEWVDVGAALDRLLRRYLELTRAGLIGETPSWAEVLNASAQRWPLQVRIDTADLSDRD